MESIILLLLFDDNAEGDSALLWLLLPRLEDDTFRWWWWWWLPLSRCCWWWCWLMLLLPPPYTLSFSSARTVVAVAGLISVIDKGKVDAAEDSKFVVVVVVEVLLPTELEATLRLRLPVSDETDSFGRGLELERALSPVEELQSELLWLRGTRWLPMASAWL